MGLEFIYVDEGLEAFDPKFDELREMILGTRPAKGWLLFPRKAEPTTSVTLEYNTGWRTGDQQLIPVGLSIYGLVVVTELLGRKAEPDEWIKEVADLIEF
jgi:hypothetical protein